uniref:Uncharacterized protein n=1 Tax=Sphaerodactylus townsendi TaxID=933632 RepID=A0ACB8GDU6_9SAUR
MFLLWQFFDAKRQPKHGASFIITRAITGPALFILRYLWYSPVKFSLPTGLVRLVNKQISWHLVLASNGKLLAAVQDQCIEIRSGRKDESRVCHWEMPSFASASSRKHLGTRRKLMGSRMNKEKYIFESMNDYEIFSLPDDGSIVVDIII